MSLSAEIADVEVIVMFEVEAEAPSTTLGGHHVPEVGIVVVEVFEVDDEVGVPLLDTINSSLREHLGVPEVGLTPPLAA